MCCIFNHWKNSKFRENPRKITRKTTLILSHLPVLKKCPNSSSCSVAVVSGKICIFAVRNKMKKFITEEPRLSARTYFGHFLCPFCNHTRLLYPYKFALRRKSLFCFATGYGSRLFLSPAFIAKQNKVKWKN